MSHDHTVAGATAAKQITAWACKHGQITLELTDAEGRAFATASFDREVWLFMAQNISDDLTKHGLPPLEVKLS